MVFYELKKLISGNHLAQGTKKCDGFCEQKRKSQEIWEKKIEETYL